MVSDVRGAGFYLEDGNEMYNNLEHNVVICPWARGDPYKRGCTIPGSPNGQADTVHNQVAFWSTGAINNMIGNRASNAFNSCLHIHGYEGSEFRVV